MREKNSFPLKVILVTWAYSIPLFHALLTGIYIVKILLKSRANQIPRFADSNPAEVDGFFQDVKILSSSPPGGTSSWESEISGLLKNIKHVKIGL